MTLELVRDEVPDVADEQLREMVAELPERTGFTYVELSLQAQSGHFESMRARTAWGAFGRLADLAPE